MKKRASTMELRELIARTLFNAQFRLRDWDHAKDWHRKALYLRADEAMRRAGVENVEVATKLTKTENIR